ncbi:hypothetical protein hairong_161 [Pseudomonas phage hairong]|nr:hypothetical protein hairong_161 [Pseudomonas phage hairong]
MPNIFIPPLGTVIQLEKDWTFALFDERRNARLIDQAGITPPYRDFDNMRSRSEWRDLTLAQRAAEIDKTDWAYTPHPGVVAGHDYDYWSGVWEHQFTFREGTELKIRRIYIRQGGEDFDSVTFSSKQWVSAPGDPLFTKRKLRTLTFWAKLRDVNNMVGRVIDG